MFSQKSCTELKALPDYSHFLFTSRGIAGSTTREVRFIRQKDTLPDDIFNLEIGDFRPETESPAGIADNGDMNYVLTTLILIIELYLERYPERVIRLKGN